MRKRVKDFSYKIKIPKKFLLKVADSLDEKETKYYRSWDEPKRDENKIPKKVNGVIQTRPINAPNKTLKYIQSQILNKVLYSISLPDYYFGGMKGKDGVLNARYHQGNKYFFLTDLKNFYPSISSHRVEEALRKEGFYPDVAKLITRLSTKSGAIPQGCPTSSFLSALVLHHSAHDLFDKYHEKGFKVSIFVDDITISSPFDFKDETDAVLLELRKRGLKMNFKKIQYCTKNPIVTGVHVKNNGICAMEHTYTKSQETNRKETSKLGHQRRIDYINKIAKQKTQ